MNREAMGRMGLDSRRMKRLDKKQRIRGPSSEIHGMSSFKYEAARRSMFTRRFGGTDEDREMMMEDVMGGNFERQNDRLVHLDLVPVFAADDFIDSEDELDKPQQ